MGRRGCFILHYFGRRDKIKTCHQSDHSPVMSSRISVKPLTSPYMDKTYINFIWNFLNSVIPATIQLYQCMYQDMGSSSCIKRWIWALFRLQKWPGGDILLIHIWLDSALMCNREKLLDYMQVQKLTDKTGNVKGCNEPFYKARAWTWFFFFWQPLVGFVWKGYWTFKN